MAGTVGTVTKLGKLLPGKTAVFVCDIQERFRPIINGMPAVVDTARRLVSKVAHVPSCCAATPRYYLIDTCLSSHTTSTSGMHASPGTRALPCNRLLTPQGALPLLQVRGANVLGLPVIVTEQYPKAFGNTVQELKDVLPPSSPVISKTLFSMLTPEVSQLLREKPTISQVNSVLQHDVQHDKVHPQLRAAD